ncbi:MAG: hypothetical protein R3F60_06120 [bacterium]
MLKWVVGALALSGGVAHGAGWTQPAGDLYAKVWGRSLLGKGVYTAAGDIKELPESYLDEALGVYAELGLTDWLTLLAAGTPVGFSRYGDESTTYVGPLALGLRAGLAAGQTRLALALTAGDAPMWARSSSARARRRGSTSCTSPPSRRASRRLRWRWGSPWASAGWP